MLSFLKKLGGDAMKKYSGDKDFLEAVCAASALTAAADGSVDDDEIVAAVEAARNNPTLTAAYSTSDIEECMDKMLKRAKSHSGRAGLKRELDDVAKKDLSVREDVFLAAMDVAASDGSISAEEQKVMNGIANQLGVDSKKFS